MANISIWPGSSSFFPGETPFGFYDADTDFQADADKVADWCVRRLGYPLVDIELQQENFFTAFEEAVTEYGTQVYQFQVINNIGNLIGYSTGSKDDTIDPNTGETIKGEGFNNIIVSNVLYLLIRNLYNLGIEKRNKLQAGLYPKNYLTSL